MNLDAMSQRLCYAIALSGVIGLDMMFQAVPTAAQPLVPEIDARCSGTATKQSTSSSNVIPRGYTLEELEAEFMSELEQLQSVEDLVEAGALPRIDLDKKRARILYLQNMLEAAEDEGLAGDMVSTRDIAPEQLQNELAIQQNIIDNLRPLVEEGAIAPARLLRAQRDLERIYEQLESLEVESLEE